MVSGLWSSLPSFKFFPWTTSGGILFFKNSRRKHRLHPHFRTDSSAECVFVGLGDRPQHRSVVCVSLLFPEPANPWDRWERTSHRKGWRTGLPVHCPCRCEVNSPHNCTGSVTSLPTSSSRWNDPVVWTTDRTDRFQRSSPWTTEMTYYEPFFRVLWVPCRDTCALATRSGEMSEYPPQEKTGQVWFPVDPPWSPSGSHCEL